MELWAQPLQLKELIRKLAKWSKSFLRVSDCRSCRQGSLDVEGIVSKKLDAPYKSGPSKAWLKIKNPNAPAATRVIEGTF
jgi:hypothetical protein